MLMVIAYRYNSDSERSVSSPLKVNCMIVSPEAIRVGAPLSGTDALQTLRSVSAAPGGESVILAAPSVMSAGRPGTAAPDPDDVVRAGGRDQRAVGTDRDAGHRGRVQEPDQLDAS